MFLAREMDICYANIALITDYDAGLEGRDDIPPVTEEEVLKVFEETTKVKKLLVIKEVDLTSEQTCC